MNLKAATENHLKMSTPPCLEWNPCKWRQFVKSTGCSCSWSWCSTIILFKHLQILISVSEAPNAPKECNCCHAIFPSSTRRHLHHCSSHCHRKSYKTFEYRYPQSAEGGNFTYLLIAIEWCIIHGSLLIATQIFKHFMIIIWIDPSELFWKYA